MRVVALVLIAGLSVPDADFGRAAKAAQGELVRIWSTCERSPQTCETLTVHVTEATRHVVTLSTVTMKGMEEAWSRGQTLLDTVVTLKTDRGTLTSEDLAPGWKGGA